MALIHFFQMLPVWLGAVLNTGWGQMDYGWAWFLGNAAMILIFDVVLLVLIAYLLLFDRKVWAAVQMRRGPNVVGPFGLLQTFAVSMNGSLSEIFGPLSPAWASTWVSDIWNVTVAQIAPIMPYLLLVLILIFRPMGLLGTRET